MSEDGSLPHLQSPPTLDHQAIVENAVLAEANGASPGHQKTSAGTHVAPAPELHSRVAQASDGQTEATTQRAPDPMEGAEFVRRPSPFAPTAD
jgi:hypothetical protein